MKLVTYHDSKGESYGVVTDGGIVNVGRALYYPDLRAVLEADALEELPSGRGCRAISSAISLSAAAERLAIPRVC